MHISRVLAESLAASRNQAEDEARFLRDMEVAMAVSKADVRAAAAHELSEREGDASTAPSPRAHVQAGPSASTSETTGASHPASDFLRERRILEQQRLARMNKAQSQTQQKTHKRSYSASLSEDESDEDARPLKRKPSKKPVVSSSSATTTANGPEGVGEMFWDGELRQTANRYTDRTDTKPTFRISEIIGDVSRSFASRQVLVTDGGRRVEEASRVCHSFVVRKYGGLDVSVVHARGG